MIYRATIKTNKTNQTATTEIEADNLQHAQTLLAEKIKGFAVIVGELTCNETHIRGFNTASKKHLRYEHQKVGRWVL